MYGAMKIQNNTKNNTINVQNNLGQRLTNKLKKFFDFSFNKKRVENKKGFEVKKNELEPIFPTTNAISVNSAADVTNAGLAVAERSICPATKNEAVVKESKAQMTAEEKAAEELERNIEGMLQDTGTAIVIDKSERHYLNQSISVMIKQTRMDIQDDSDPGMLFLHPIKTIKRIISD